MPRTSILEMPVWQRKRPIQATWLHPNSLSNLPVAKSRANRIAFRGGAISAAVAQQLYTLLVGGSNPSSPTIFLGKLDTRPSWQELRDGFEDTR